MEGQGPSNSDIFRNMSENFDDDEEKDEEEKDKKKTPTRSLFFSEKELSEKETDEKEVKKSKSLTEFLLGEELEDEENKKENENTYLNPEDTGSEDSATEEFRDSVEERVDETIEVPTSVTPAFEEAVENQLLSQVVENIDEGQQAEQAIEDAEQTVSEQLEDIQSIVTTEDEGSFEDKNEVLIAQDTETVPTETAIEELEDDNINTSSTPSNPPVNPPVPPQNPPNNGQPNVGGINIPPNINQNLYPINGGNFNTTASPVETTDSEDVTKMNEMYYRRRNTGRVLLAGALGYVLGRRRGRIKTEEKLQPQINQKTEKIDELETQLANSENTVQERSRDLEEAISAKKRAENETAKRKETVETTELLMPIEVMEKTEDLESKTTVEKVENIITKRVETREDAPESSRFTNPERSKDVSMMNLQEVLNIADHIGFESTTVRKLFEARSLDPVNLRRIVNEYLRGGNYERMLISSLEAVKIRNDLRHEIKQEESFEDFDNKRDFEAQNNQQNTANQNQQSTQNSQGQSDRYANSDVDDFQNVKEFTEKDETFLVSAPAAVAIAVGTIMLIIFLIYLYSGSL